jgi:hypothetical protein
VVGFLSGFVRLEMDAIGSGVRICKAKDATNASGGFFQLATRVLEPMSLLVQVL